MKLQIDTDNKIIKIEGTVKLQELFDVLQRMLPDQWQNFMLETNTTIINWTNPIQVVPYQPYIPNYPWYNDPFRITCDNVLHSSPGHTFSINSTVNPTGHILNAGVYNVEIAAEA